MHRCFGVFALWLAVVGCGFPVAAQQPESGSAAADRPNVVIILSDDQAWTDYGFMGHPVIKTPHLDELASQSVVFTDGYVPTSLCRPSLATLISGLYPHQHGVTGNDPAAGVNRNEMLRFIRKMPKLPKLLGQEGYVSYQAGKWWEGTPADGGFTAGMTHGDITRGGRHGDLGLKTGREGLTDLWQFLDTHKQEPFFLWYAPMMPHTPHTPPERLLKKYEQAGRDPKLAKYYAMCEWFDETCGDLLGGLEERGLSENTLVVYLADNGWIQRTADTKDIPKGWGFPFAPKSKRSPYDGGLRTPIILRWPAQIEPQRYETLVSSIDIAPTILIACGLVPPSEMPGQNLLGVIKAGGVSERNTVFGEIYSHEEPNLENPIEVLSYRWCRRGEWKLIVPTDGSPAELYNVEEDPFETKNLAAKRPDMVIAVQANLDAWWNPETTRQDRPILPRDEKPAPRKQRRPNRQVD